MCERTTISEGRCRSLLAASDRLVELVEIVRVLDPLHVPALRLEPAADVSAVNEIEVAPSIVIRFAS